MVWREKRWYGERNDGMERVRERQRYGGREVMVWRERRRYGGRGAGMEGEVTVWREIGDGMEVRG